MVLAISLILLMYLRDLRFSIDSADPISPLLKPLTPDYNFFLYNVSSIPLYCITNNSFGAVVLNTTVFNFLTTMSSVDTSSIASWSRGNDDLRTYPSPLPSVMFTVTFLDEAQIPIISK